MLNWLIPGAAHIARHPVYWIEARRLPKRELPRLILYSLQWILRVVAIVISLWLAYVLLILKPLLSTYSYSYMSAVWDNYMIFFLSTIGAGILLDLVSVLVSVNSITGDKLSGRWDYIMVADMHPLETMQAKHSAAQLRAWRGMIILTGLRISLMLIAFIQVFFVTAWVEQMSVFEVLDGFFEVVSDSSFEMMSVLIVFVTYLIEPLWRMRAVTALSIALSARGWRFTMTLLACFAGVVGMWVSQALLIVFVIWLTTELLPDYISYDYFWRSCFVLYVFGFACMIYFYYRYLRLWSLRRAASAAFRT